MQNTDFSRFAEILTGMSELYEKRLNEPVLDAYWLALRDWTLADFQKACAHLMRTSTFMPRPADFTSLVMSAGDSAGEAWSSARQWLIWGLYGYTLDDRCPELIARTVRAIGGPNVIAMCEESKLTFLERRFTEHYETLKASESARDALPWIGKENPLRLMSERG